MPAAKSNPSSDDGASVAGALAFNDVMEKSRVFLSKASGSSQLNIQAILASVAAATKGAEALGGEAMALSKTMLERQVEAARSLSGVKSAPDLIALQSAYAKSTLETYMAAMASMSEMATVSAKEAFEPLNVRITASLQDFQVAG